MASSIDLEPAAWPVVPLSERPRSLYVSENISPEAEAAFSEKGWKIVDVRLMAYDSDQDRDKVIKATFAGIRMGSIQNRQGLKDFLELEARSCGTIGNKEPAKPQDAVLNKGTVDQLLTQFAPSTRSNFKLEVPAAPVPAKKSKKKQ